jgi:hypothetical protein
MADTSIEFETRALRDDAERAAVQPSEEERLTETGLYWLNFYNSSPLIRWFFW